MTAADVMKRGVTCVREDEEISDVAWLVARRGLGMLPVLREGRLVGVISRSDLVRLYAAAR
jgi:CBS domain-containing protein